MRGRGVFVLLLVLSALAALQLAAAAQPRPGRKLLQWGWGGGGWGGSGAQSYVAAQNARWATQNAIRSAVNNPFPEQQFAATNAATTTGQVTSTLASWQPCALAWGCAGPGWGWGRRM